jgi:hypothetical protein
MKESEVQEQHTTLHREREPVGREAGTVQPGIADADKQARTGRTEEPVRNTPPAGDWNDVA